jgi:xanthosine utilization system XapX-like protein
MATLVTIIISLLAGAIVVTMTAPPAVAIVTVCGVVLVAGILAKAADKF